MKKQGRNEPCACGSGKKYKKCCVNKEVVSQDHLVDDELDQVIQQHADKILQATAHIDEINRLTLEWKERLEPFTEVDDIEELVTEYYLFITQRKLWQQHIQQTLDDTLRSQTRAVLQDWQQPHVLLGKIIKEDKGYYTIEEVFGNQTYRIDRESFDFLGPDYLVVGLFMPDNRNVDNGVYSLGDFIGIQDPNNYRADKIQELAELSGTENSEEFFDDYMLDIYEIIMDTNVESVQQIIDEKLTHFQETVVESLTNVLENQEIEQAKIESIQMVAISYVLQKRPSFRKPEIIAAATFKAVDNYGLFGRDTFYSQQDVAKMFDVSVSSITRHIEPLEEILKEFVVEVSDDSLEE